MHKSKMGWLFIYIAITGLVGLVVFGESGILDNISKSQEIVRLTSAMQKSQSEIDEMTNEYNRLLAMRTPTQAFLIDQGRKSRDIVVFKNIVSSDYDDDLSSLEKDQKLFFVIGVGALIILLLGFIGIAIVDFRHKKEEVTDV